MLETSSTEVQLVGTGKGSASTRTLLVPAHCFACSPRPTVISQPYLLVLPNRAFRPPHGMSELKVPVEFASSPFEWDQMSRKEGVQLWAIRVPMNVRDRLSSSRASCGEVYSHVLRAPSTSSSRRD
jgi:hypothetical protein